MNLKEVKTLIVGTIKQSFANKKTLDKFDGTSGTLKYNGVPVNNVPVFVADDSPVGSVISFMGNTVPQDYLICDGTVYNIADYPLLAQHMLDEFGNYNYFGGDGETTFAVPDLRGEFLRGTGTAERDTGSGDDVGVHQEPTEIPSIFVYDGTLQYTMPKDAGKGNNLQTNIDKGLNDRKSARYTSTGTINEENYENNLKYTVRPTNTSVLYCIKYQITQNNISKDMVNYSLEEQVVGSWVDGRPLYQKTIISTIPETKEDGVIVSSTITTINDSDYILLKETYYKQDSLQGILPSLDIKDNNILYCIVYSNNQNIIVFNSIQRYSNRTIYVVVQYTKTTDAENSFTPDMLSNISTLNTTASDEEVNEVIGGI